MFQKKIKFLSLIWHCVSSKSVGPYRGVRDKNCVNVSRMQWIYSFLLLLAFLFFFLIGIQKLRLGFKIFTNEAQLEIFNTAVALCLVVSGNISNKQTFSCLIFVPGTLGLVSLFITAWLLVLGDQGHLNNTKTSISDKKLFGKEPHHWVDGSNPLLEPQYRFCANEDMHAVNNGTPPTPISLRILRNFTVQESCQSFSDVQGKNSSKRRKDKRRRREGGQKRVVGELESVRRSLMCWIHLQTHFLQWIFYLTNFYNSLWWRYFLIRWPHGFIRYLEFNPLCWALAPYQGWGGQFRAVQATLLPWGWHWPFFPLHTRVLASVRGSLSKGITCSFIFGGFRITKLSVPRTRCREGFACLPTSTTSPVRRERWSKRFRWGIKDQIRCTYESR